MKVAIIGASGMIGSRILKRCLEDEKVTEVVSFGRRELDIQSDKLKQVVSNQLELSEAYTDHLTNTHAAFSCVGLYTGDADAATFRKVTTDIPVAFAEALENVAPQSIYCFLSGQGADPTEKSRLMFARDKGAAERIIGNMSLKSFHTFRPAYIYPVEKRVEPNFTYRLSRSLYPLIKRMGSNMSITSHQLGDAMFEVGVGSTEANEFLSNKEIIDLLL
ncbi:hypothetical protein [Sanyastnella coralliicola]|uniref:hypothetical protein n=1 Tax=Sanyastnella coralliicola TaxID=3069118 RepID=UPI0027BA0800|nr:hypothetical protein [Longitalea sp. SCSIO 12813]